MFRLFVLAGVLREGVGEGQKLRDRVGTYCKNLGNIMVARAEGLAGDVVRNGQVFEIL